MTPEAQRIAIAEACGWVWYRLPIRRSDNRVYRCLFLPAIHEYDGQSKEWLVRADGTERICNITYMAREGYVPNYLHDLNAILAVVREKIEGHYKLECAFLAHLDAMSHRRKVKCVSGNTFGLLTCSAAEYCEAALVALGKWVEEEAATGKEGAK